MTTLNLPWPVVLKRSIACAACRLMFLARGVPCIRHTRESERPARARIVGMVA